MNPHKWLFTPFDCSVLFSSAPDVLKRAFSLVPEYLVTREQDEVVNYMDYGVQLGRRFRALKLWMVIRAFGVEGLADRLRAHCALARTFADWVGERARMGSRRRRSPFHSSAFVTRRNGVEREASCDAINEAIMHAVNASGEAFLSHTKLNGRFTLRFAIGNIRTAEEHVAGRGSF